MKGLTLLSVVALMLACAGFASGAMAQPLGDVESVKLGPGGSVLVTGTVQCVEGKSVTVDLEVLQSTGNKPFDSAARQEGFDCESTGPTPFTFENLTGEAPFRKGEVTVSEAFTVCDSNTGVCEETVRTVEVFRLR